MSGGYFEYDQYRIRQVAEEIKDLIDKNNSQELSEIEDRIAPRDDFGYPIGRNYSPEVIEKFKEGYYHLRMAEIYAHRIDWLVSSDDDEKSFLERLEENLKDVK